MDQPIPTNLPIAPPPVPPTVNPIPPNPPSKFPILIALMATVILGLSGYIAYLKLSPNVKSTPLPSPSPTETSAKENDPTSTWQTFPSEAFFPYTFKYPQDLKLEYSDGFYALTKWGPTQQANTEFYDGLSLRFASITSLEPNQTLQQYVQDKIEISQSSADSTIIKALQPVTIANLSGYSYTSKGLGEFEYIFLQTPETDQIVRIINGTQDPTNQGFQQTISQILQTFQFTN